MILQTSFIKLVARLLLLWQLVSNIITEKSSARTSSNDRLSIKWCFDGTASSAPIGVSNIVNLIALKIVHMSLYMHTAMMFVPATLGLLFMSGLMYGVLKKRLPVALPTVTYDI